MSSNIIWNNSDPLPIEMTVAIPAYKVENIIWLALESLRNQIGINFGWELIIWEEYGKSKKIIEDFFEKLNGCQRIVYKVLNKRVLLLDKWLGMAREADPKSKIFVMQGADDYSPVKRLWIHYEHFKNSECYISTQFLGLYYNLLTADKIFYYGINKEKINSRFFSQYHLNLAVLIRDIKRIKRIYLINSIDLYIKNSIGKLHNINFAYKKNIYTDYDLDKNNWKYGLFTNGYNGQQTDKEFLYKNPTGIFLPFNRNVIVKYNNIENYIPENVLEFIKKFKNKFN